MKRTPEEGAGSGVSPDARLEAFFAGFLQRHPRFFLYGGIVLAVLIILALLVAKLSG